MERDRQDPKMTKDQILKHYETSGFRKACGIHIDYDSRSDSFTGWLEVLPMHLNGSGHIHGGLLYTLADNVGGANARQYSDHVTTLDSDFHFLSSTATRYLRGRSELIRNGGAIVVLQIRLYDDCDEVLAEGTFTYYKLD